MKHWLPSVHEHNICELITVPNVSWHSPEETLCTSSKTKTWYMTYCLQKEWALTTVLYILFSKYGLGCSHPSFNLLWTVTALIIMYQYLLWCAQYLCDNFTMTAVDRFVKGNRQGLDLCIRQNLKDKVYGCTKTLWAVNICEHILMSDLSVLGGPALWGG